MISKNSVIYQLLTDRFDNGSSLYSIIKSPDYNKRFSDYLGGTFNGISNKVEYLKDLGITHLLLSPVQLSDEYHGYTCKSSFTINQNFGGEEELKKLIKVLHDNNIKVIMDYVSTHLSSFHPLFISTFDNDENKDLFLFTDRIKKNPEYHVYFDELVFKLTSGNPQTISEINKKEYLCYFGLEDHPLLNLLHPKVISFHKECLSYLLSNFNFDSIRFDSGFIQPRKYIKEINNFLKNKFPSVDLLIEYWDLDGSFGKISNICDGEFDIHASSILNKFSDNKKVFNNMINHYYSYKSLLLESKAVLYLDNHDLPRFNGSISEQKIAALLQFTFPHIPLVYYGDELGMRRYNDGSNRIAQSRDPMRFDLMYNNPLLYFYKKLINFRKEAGFESKYEISNIQINDYDQLLTYMISSGNGNYFVIINRENREKPIDINLMFPGHYLNNKDLLSEYNHEFGEGKWLKLEAESVYLFKEKD